MHHNPVVSYHIISHRLSEVEMFAGTVRSLAAKYNLPVPVNDWLYKKIKKLEAAY